MGLLGPLLLWGAQSPTFPIAEAASHGHEVRTPITIAPEGVTEGYHLILHVPTLSQRGSDLPPVPLQCTLDFL